uniref:Putative secreted protein n=1 Tax=Anopheles darlingi TaxID=43151 RepID=A0A2M4D838_ANODA
MVALGRLDADRLAVVAVVVVQRLVAIPVLDSDHHRHRQSADTLEWVCRAAAEATGPAVRNPAMVAHTVPLAGAQSVDTD